MKKAYDVIVFGGGTAGTIAAIQAGRAGASTLLIEKSAMLGGTITGPGINAPAHFFAWGRPIVAGIGWELVKKSLEEAGDPIPTAEMTLDKERPQTQPLARVNIPIFAALCDAAVLDAGVDLLFHSMPGAVALEDGGWQVTVCSKEGLQSVKAKVLVDATGDANVVTLAGLPVHVPETIQPATLSVQLSGYDPSQLDYDALKKATEEAAGRNELKSTDISWSQCSLRHFLSARGYNANHITAPDAQTSSGRTAIEIEARQSIMRAFRFLRKQPGLESLAIESITPETGIRESVTIQGKTTITRDDYISGKQFDDALCYAFYPIDEHLNDGGGIHKEFLGEGVLPTVPRGALLPQNSRNLIVAGRCLASDRMANSGLRVEGSCMAMGQAAGAMAALTALTDTDPEQLPLQDIHKLLRAHDAIIPGEE